MPELTDHELLADFARSESEEAFAALVARYLNLVYSTALRSTGNSHHAEEITQAVFIILTRKAAGLSPRVVLSGWLYQTTRLTAANFVKGEIRRQRREQEAYMQSTLNEPDTTAWDQIAPLLDDAMGRLNEKDRNAVVLRFFENKTAAEAAAALQLTEAATHKRTSRALDKLRKFFSRHGVSSTTAIISGAISAHSIHTAPAALAKSVTVVAAARGAASGSLMALVKGTLKIMAWTKAQTAIVAGAVVLLAAGTIGVKEYDEHRTYSWEVPKFDYIPVDAPTLLGRTPPQVRILRSRYSYWVEGTPFIEGDGASFVDGQKIVHTNQSKAIGIGVKLPSVIETAYGDREHYGTIYDAPIPEGRYDFIANLPQGALQALREQIRTKFGLIGEFEPIDTNILALEVINTNALKLKSAGVPGTDLKTLRGSLQGAFPFPVIDETGLTNDYDFTLKWPLRRTADSEKFLKVLNEDLSQQLGLELVHTNMAVRMLVVEKAK